MNLRDTVRYAVLFLSIGCANSPTDPARGGGRPPVTPGPVQPFVARQVSGNVYAERENNCPLDAAVEVVDGPKAGFRVVQDHKVCVAEGNGWISFTIDGLPPETPVTLRASAPGYASQDKVVVPSGVPQRFVLLKQ
jgi:hypothetical protein